MKTVFEVVFVISGAGDNAISCAIMLEIIRVISQSSTPLHHSMIFLFNGAEENLLQVKLFNKIQEKSSG